MRSRTACTWECRCGIKYSVMSDDPDLQLLPSKFKCWAAVTKCRYYLKRNDKTSPGPVVRAVTLYQMINGLGAPTEKKCAPADMHRLVGKKLISIAVEPSSDKNRAMISSFTLEGGLTVHLAPSTRGVTVFKVTQS